jgi:hypothetical protein
MLLRKLRPKKFPSSPLVPKTEALIGYNAVCKFFASDPAFGSNTDVFTSFRERIYDVSSNYWHLRDVYHASIATNELLLKKVLARQSKAMVKTLTAPEGRRLRARMARRLNDAVEGNFFETLTRHLDALVIESKRIALPTGRGRGRPAKRHSYFLIHELISAWEEMNERKLTRNRVKAIGLGDALEYVDSGVNFVAKIAAMIDGSTSPAEIDSAIAAVWKSEPLSK